MTLSAGRHHVPFDEVTGPRSVTGSDGGDDLPVLRGCTPLDRGSLEREPEQRAQLALQGEFLARQPRRLRGGGDLEVEVPLGPAPGAGVLRRGQHVRRALQPRDVLG